MAARLVSIVVPVFNGADFLGECLDSLVGQDYDGPIEIVVVDDGSTDESAAIAARYPGVLVVAREHEGLGRTRNAGIDASTGELIAFCDADDFYRPHKVRVQVEYLDAHPDVDLVLCRQDTVFEDGAEHPDWLIPDQVRGDLDGVSPTSALYRRAVFDTIRFRTDMVHGTDFNLLVQARTAGFGIALVEEPLRVRRIHGDNMTTREGPALAPMFQSVRDHLRKTR
jgi:glycosyltransferase involved in cell wall biosynthesis